MGGGYDGKIREANTRQHDHCEHGAVDSNGRDTRCLNDLW